LLLTCDITGGGVDYDSGPYTVRFPAGQTSVLFDIFINDDNILEENEIFSLTIDSGTLPDHIVVDTSHEVTVIILDNDGKYIINSHGYFLFEIIML